jgi:UDP-perosamine 4-acetyltransferase
MSVPSNINSTLIFACGFQGKIVTEICQGRNKIITAYVNDDDSLKSFKGKPVLSRQESLTRESRDIIIALGNDNPEKINLKKDLINFYRQYSFSFPRAIDSNAVISTSASIEEGVIIHPGTIIMPDTTIGAFSIISTSSSIDHDNNIADFCNICPGVITAGSVTMETGAFIGTGAVILPEIIIGKNAIIGAGSVVTKNVSPNAKVVGNPARVIG